MTKWIRFSMKNAGVIFLAMIMIVAGGLYSIFSMKLEQFPNVDVPYLNVVVVYPGATPEQALDGIGKPLEQALSGLKKLKNLYVEAGTNYVSATMEFELSHSMDEATKDVNSVLANLKLPEGAEKPRIRQEGPTAAPIYSFGVTANQDPATIKQYVNEHIQPLLASIQGISSLDVQGVPEKKLYIRVDPEKLRKENLSIDKVKQALLANNVSFPAGEVTIDGKSLNVEAGKKIRSAEELKNVNLIVIDQDTSQLTNAFQTLGEGVGTVGSSVGQLGKGVGDLTKGQMLLQAEIQVMQAINGLSASLFDDQANLAALKQQLQARPEQKPQLEPQINQLQQKIQAEQAQIASLQNKLADLQAQVNASNTDVANSLKSMSGKSAPANRNQEVSAKPSLSLRTIKLSDIADVTYASDKDRILSRLNGIPAVLVDIKTEPGSNTVDIVKQINQKLDKLSLPDGYRLTKLRDNSVQIQKSVNGMLREVVLGSLLAVVVTLLFLRNVRATLVAIISIPLSILASMIVLYWMDYSFNIMTLAGIAVAVGRVVDDSIVVIENIYRRVGASALRSWELVLEATKEVGQAITSSTFTTIAVFGPLSFVPGIVGRFFAPFGITVVIALAFSLLVAITVVPLAARLFLLNIKHQEHRENALQRMYRSVLGWSLQHKLVVVLVAVLLFGGSLALLPRIPKNFLPSEKTVSYGLRVTLPVGTSLQTADQVANRIESFLSGRSDIKSYQTTLNGETIRMQIELKDDVSPEDTKKFEQAVREHTTDLGPGIRAALTPQGITGGGGLFIVVNGTDLTALKQAGEMMANAIRDVPGLANVETNLSAVRPQLFVDIHTDEAARKGLNPAMIASAIRQMINGDSVMNVTLDGRTTEVNLGLKVDDLKTIDAIRNQVILNMTGEQVKLGDVVNISEKPGPTAIQRLNQQEYVSVRGSFTSDNSSGIQTEVENRIKKLNLPKGVTYYFEGESKAMSDGFRNMAIAMAAGVLLVYMVMMIAFGETVAPFSILFSLPFIFTGGLLGLYAFNESLGMPALVGFLMLIGIVVTNAIVLVDRVQQNRLAGMDIGQALIEAGVTRIRPILMTAVATIGALLPLAISDEGGLISKSLAIVVISGLTTSTLMTLVIVPVAYQALNSIRNRIWQKKRSEHNRYAITPLEEA
ncbi:efflux RND transporter permease subunit [Effusibacillus pohliae]|uniref:efflux RND transporter permease subunit n=1 Tax=Effusibacillus pohliae TaxID=232270 RepID=UPI0003746E5E|nr:efflux RND transporter permease subunit [Effusibacillus pohliae]